MFKSVSWMALLRGFAKGLALVKTLILARILTPTQFGIFGVASLVLGFLEIITETGINVVLIQEDDDIKKHLNSAFFVSILRGLFLFAIILLLAKPISVFFNNPDSIKLLYLTAFIPLVRGFINPAEIKFQKELNFQKEFLFKGALVAIEMVTAITLGFLTKSEFCLVWGLLASAFLEVLISQIYIKPRPSMKFNLPSFTLIVKSGIWVTLAGIFNYIFHHGDDVVVGKILGVTPLGLYQQAYRISSLPVTELGEVFNKVTFPYYSKYKVDKRLLKITFLKSLIGTSVVVIPFGLIILLFPYQTIHILLGDAWLEAQGVLQVLSIFGILKALSNNVYPLFLGLSRQKWVTWITLVSIIAMGISIFPLTLKYGISGTAASTIIGTLATIPLIIVMLFKTFKN